MSIEKPRILLADDEFHMRAFIAALLKKIDCEVVGQATNGAEAIALYREKKPDLLLLDINMPVKTGMEALADVRAEFPDAKVIMLTSVVDEQNVVQCVEAGAAGYIRKDSPVAEIQATITEILRAK